MFDLNNNTWLIILVLIILSCSSYYLFNYKKESFDNSKKVTFKKHIRPLFTNHDIESMAFHFDLSKYEDVKAYGDAIYERVKDGSMPCRGHGHGPWSKKKVELFKRWIDGGYKK